ncbi:helix-turn-helix domain-containing protein [Ruminococcaceae bacterium OttesenSCG-928-A16]|nr:helix-turn-helix domain-containing protein [Ruminococcaceae bacterium OttesenSCG-928-A16]
MRQQLLTSLLEGRVETEILHPKMAEYGMNLEASTYCVAVIRYDAPGSKEEQPGTTALLSISLQQMITERLTGSLQLRMIPMLNNNLMLLFLLQAGQTVQQVVALLNQLFLPAKRLLGLQLSVGVGKQYARLEAAATSCTEAKNALEYQMLVGSGQCVYIGDIEPGNDDTHPEDILFAEEIVRQIKVGTEADLHTAVQALVQHFRNSTVSMQQYQIFLLEMSAELLKLIKSYKLDADAPQISKTLLENSSMQFSSLDEMGRWLFEYCEQLQTRVRRERKDTTKTMIEHAKNYLAAHYSESDLSVEAISSELKVSPAYFSTIFKKETGLNFVSYLTQLRVEKALEYLNTTDEKAYIIAEKIGYQDPNYFSYVFKKQVGVSPSKYRAGGKTDERDPQT